MKKLIMLMAVIAAIVLGGYAENVVTERSIATVADTTVTTNYIYLTRSTDARGIEKIVVKNNGANTASINMDIADIPDGNGVTDAVFTDLATYSLATTASTNDFPVRAGAWGTNPAPYLAMALRVICTLNATNATQANIDYYIYGDKD